jgi:hypothetical protein
MVGKSGVIIVIQRNMNAHFAILDVMMLKPAKFAEKCIMPVLIAKIN